MDVMSLLSERSKDRLAWLNHNAEWTRPMLDWARPFYDGTVPGSRYPPGEPVRVDVPHDAHHLDRVWPMAIALALIEAETRGVDADLGIVFAAAVGHDLAVSSKIDPGKASDTERSAVLVSGYLRETAWRDLPDREGRIRIVADIVRACSVSKNLDVRHGLEEEAVRDADLLECFGAVGLMRFVAASADLGRPFAPLDDPSARNREPDGWKWVTDAVIRRGLRKAPLLRTEAARRLAKDRLAFLSAFLDQVEDEFVPLGRIHELLP